ncbi:hypothetical protein [Psychromarinibacter sp. S121]|uniref:hypothetical protein n=1 Tax=Psychromarinibacter sp. S121 TaxID=3415127 RepID=UPI003C7B5FD5
MEQGAYRISFQDGDRTIRGLVPETLVTDWLLKSAGPRPEHQDVYTWIALHRTKIEKALTKMSRGDTRIRAPFDRLSLVEE